MAQTDVVVSIPADGVTTYQRALIERAPNSSGVPGAYTQIANVLIDKYNQYTVYQDLGGTTTDWYRYRWANTALTNFSSYSDAIQAGDYLIRQWIKNDIPDTDLDNTDWDFWRDQVIADLSLKYIGRKLYPPQTLTPSGYDQQFFPLAADIRRVVKVDMHSGGYFFTEIPNWRQWGRYIVIDRPEPTATYKVYGVGFLRGLSDLDPELFMLVYWGIRLKYIDKRIAERNNFKYFLNADKVSDVTLPQLEAHRNQALNEFNSRLATVSESIGLPVG